MDTDTVLLGLMIILLWPFIVVGCIVCWVAYQVGKILEKII